MGMTKSLDLGCGAQPRNTFNVDEVFGVDVKSIPHPYVKQADLVIDPIPFDDEMFEFVTAYDFLEHIPRVVYAPARRNSFIEVMNEVYRVLKAGGIFLSSTPAFPHGAAFRDPTHVNIITEETFPLYFDDVNRWGSAYGFTGAFSILSQEWQGSLLLTMMKKVVVA